MVTSKRAMDAIKAIIEKRYTSLMVTILGPAPLTTDEIKKLTDQGIKVSEKPSMMELVYYHGLLVQRGTKGPASITAHQSRTQIPASKTAESARQHANESMKNSIEKLKQDTASKILGLIQENNQNARFAALNHIEQTEKVQKLVKESTLGKLKQSLRDTSKEANRNWSRVAVTEISNTIGFASVDRVISHNETKTPDDIFVYRIPVVDAALCAKCREFYLDSDGSPKLYKLSTLLSNGSNYGKPRSEWRPVIGATHPNDRESGIIELKPGWKLLPGGRQTFVGNDGWNDYIVNKLQN